MHRVQIKHPRLSTSIGPLKGIPYEPEDRGDGHPNIGFRPLKCRPQDCSLIPEARDEPGLLDALQRLNAMQTAFFTSGCEKCYNQRGVKECPIGYIAFAHNSIAMARDENTYWQILEEFDREMVAKAYDLPIALEYIVSPTRFNAHDVDGFSAVVYVRGCDYLHYKIARPRWRQALSFLTTFLCSMPTAVPPLFYEYDVT